MDVFNVKGQGNASPTRVALSEVSPLEFHNVNNPSKSSISVSDVSKSLSGGVTSEYSCEDDLSSVCKAVTSNDSGMLCWNEINELPSGNLPPIKELQSHLFNPSSSNIVPSLITADACENKTIVIPNFSVSDNSGSFQPTYQQVADSISTGMMNITTASISDSIQEIKMDQLNYMNILACEPDLDNSEMESCSVSDSSIASLNQNISSTPLCTSSLLSITEDKSSSVSSATSELDEMSQAKAHSILMNLLTKISNSATAASSSVNFTNTSESHNLLSSINVSQQLDQNIITQSSKNIVHDGLLSSHGVLKLPESKETATAQDLLNSLMNPPISNPTAVNANFLLNISSASTTLSTTSLLSPLTKLSLPAVSATSLKSNLIKANILNQGSQSTTIVPSIKNIITCPAPVQLLCIPDSSDALKAHSTQSNAKNYEPSSSKDVNEVAREEMLIEQVSCQKCKLCSYISLDKQNVIQHIRDQHRSVEQPSGASTMPSAVNESVKNSVQKSDLEAISKHMDTESQNHIIANAATTKQLKSKVNQNASFNALSQPTLSLPISINPSISGPIIMNTPVNSISSCISSPKVGLHEKIKNVNGNILKFLCSYCSETFISLQQLNIHLINQHKIILNLKPTVNSVSEQEKIGKDAKKNVTTKKVIFPSKKNLMTGSKSMSLDTINSSNVILNNSVVLPQPSGNPCINTHEVKSSVDNKKIEKPWLAGEGKGVDVKSNNTMISNVLKNITEDPINKKLQEEDKMDESTDHSKKAVSTFACEDCQTSFTTVDRYNAHVIAKHQTCIADRSLSSSKCCVVSSNKSQPMPQQAITTKLNEGISEEKEENLNPVSSCEDNETPSELRKHHHTKKKTKADGTYICDFKRCNVSFRLEKHLLYHKKCHIHDKKTTGFCCPTCQTKIEQWRNMTTHLWKVHLIDLELYKCDFCDYRTWSFSRLHSSHRLIHGEARAFLCDVCGKSFKTSKQMQNHKIIHSSKKKIRRPGSSHACDICGKSFRHSKILQLHKEAVHEKIRPYLCNFCGYCASSRSSLKMHLRLHTGEKPYSCNLCVYKTSDHNSLRRHKMRHSGEKPYKCPYCHYACIQSSTYKAHLKKKHFGKEDGLLYSCSYCSFKTIRQGILDSHLSDHHIEAIPITKFSCLENNSSLDESISINLLPENDGSVTLTSKGKSVKVIEFVQIPDSNAIETPGMEANLQNMVSSNMCTPLSLPDDTTISLSAAATSLPTSLGINVNASNSKESVGQTVSSAESTSQLMYF